MTIQAIWDKAIALRGCLWLYKTLSSRRRYKEDEDKLMFTNQFVSDEAKLLSSKAVRKLAHLTQVFTAPASPLIRSRGTHVGEVVACAVVTSEMLGLNTDLVRAIAIGHDIGHVPFGHQGEAWLAKAMGKPTFCHEVMGVIKAQKIERLGAGLNLTWHTLDGMLRHSGHLAQAQMSPEAWVVRYTDKFAYIFADANDIIQRMRYPISAELNDLVNEFGTTQRERTTTAIAGLVIESAEGNKVCFEHSELGVKFNKLRTLMYQVYPHVTQQNVESSMGPVLEFLRSLNVCDPFLLLALMVDRDVMMLANEPMRDLQSFNRTSLAEVLKYLQQLPPIDLCDPDLNW